MLKSCKVAGKPLVPARIDLHTMHACLACCGCAATKDSRHSNFNQHGAGHLRDASAKLPRECRQACMPTWARPVHGLHKKVGRFLATRCSTMACNAVLLLVAWSIAAGNAFFNEGHFHVFRHASANATHFHAHSCCTLLYTQLRVALRCARSHNHGRSAVRRVATGCTRLRS